MEKNTKKTGFCTEEDQWSVLEQIAREGARQMLNIALENEIAEYIEKYKKVLDKTGKRVVVKNGYHTEREILTGIGAIEIKQPRVDDRNLENYGEEERFSSKILPRYLRRIPSIDNLIPVLYLKGISSNDFPTALSSILGEGAKGLSSANIVRLKQCWEAEYKEWSKGDLSEKKYVYFWVDGIYFNVRLDDERSCILVIMAADEDGNKELLSVSDGFRESKTAWKEILLNLKDRGLEMGPNLAVGDGALGFWGALEEVYPKTRRQRCWVHKTANILDKLPKSIQSKAKSMIHDMYMAETKASALKAFDHFVESFESKYP